MILNFDSTYFFSNYNHLVKLINEEVPKSYAITKNNENVFEFVENEVQVLRIDGPGVYRDFKSHYNSKHEFLSNNRVSRKPKMTSKITKCTIYITSKYIHIIYESNQDKIALTKIEEINVGESITTIIVGDKAFQLVFNSLVLSLQFALLIDALKINKLDDTLIGKTMNINIGNNI